MILDPYCVNDPTMDTKGMTGYDSTSLSLRTSARLRAVSLREFVIASRLLRKFDLLPNPVLALLFERVSY